MKTQDIVILGGGSAGWMTAATLVKAFPNKTIKVIESKDVPILGVGESTLGGIRRWTHYLGISEKDFFKETNASLKLSIKFTDFYKKDFGSFHYPFGSPDETQSNPFFEWHLKKYFYPATPTQDMARSLFPATALFENNKFSLNENGKFGNFNPDLDVAYHFDATKFGIWLRDNYCILRGVEHIQGTVDEVISNDSGVEYLHLDTGEKVYADLFIDCTGFKSLLLDKSLKEPFVHYSDLLPNNKALAVQLPYKNKEKELEGFTNSTAIGNGWCWNIPLWSRLGTGYVYSDKYISTEEAKEEFKEYLMSDKMIIPRTREEVDSLQFKEISMRVGIHERTFVKNVVAIGLSAGFIEPLESNGLFSVHEFLFRFIDILQRGEINQFDRDLYNVEVRNLFDGFAKFVAMHYSLSHRDDTQYWKDIQNKTFTGVDNDPYSYFYSKSSSFYDLGERYLQKWEFADPSINNGGIPYIATGMQFKLLNDARIAHIQNRFKRDLKEEAKLISNFFSTRRSQWLLAANDCLSLHDYLKENYYNNDN